MFPVLETPRLILRAPIEADLDGFAALMSDEVASRFIGGVQTRAASWRFMAALAGSWVLKGFSMFSVIEKSTGRWIGRLGPWNPEGWPAPEIGWTLVRAAWGKGYASEGAKAAMDWAFEHLGWEDVIHCIHPDNVNSIALAKRMGSTYRGLAILPAPLAFDVLSYGQTREEWRANKTVIPEQAGIQRLTRD